MHTHRGVRYLAIARETCLATHIASAHMNELLHIGYEHLNNKVLESIVANAKRFGLSEFGSVKILPKFCDASWKVQ